MGELEELVLGLVIGTGIADPGNRELRILNSIILCAAFTESSSVHSDHSGMSKIRVNAIESGCIGDRDVNLIAPCHCFADLHLLLLRRIHVPLGANDQLRSFHGAVSPNFWVIAIVANDHRHLHAFWTFHHACSQISGRPSFDGSPRQELAVFFNDFALVVDQDQCIVWILIWVILVLLTRQRKDAPTAGLLARLAEHICQRSGNGARGIEHFLLVVHDAHCRIFWKDNQVHPG
mmetsp:Transcript_11269/g.23862  ORF Transcript_11269/g.23862 Transcript_11269/m.23862 type:complete len:234 (-) Transcript_11269:368-1069(-)